ncbi:MAG: HYR domain-containing protein, partial [Candidatus Nitrosopelagicus sp.]|nr:HYR domain-containing protein [Candidatus Nitrosopelagicus sp.]
MISILKSKFLILGFVFVALMLIPVNDAFADHTTSITLETRTDGGTEAQFEVHGNGIYDVFDEIKVWIDKDNFNSNSEIFKQFSTPFNDNQFPIEVLKVNDGYYMIFVSIDNLSDGEHKVKIDAIQTRHGPTRTLDGGDGISLIVGNPTPTLAITNLSHYNCDSPAPPNHNQNWCNGTDHYRIDVDGSTTGLASSQPLSFKITDSNGNTVRDYSSFYGTASGPPGFGYEGPVFYDSTFTEQYNGSFTVTICAPEFDVCDAESFTINSIVEDPDDDTTPPIIVLPANYQVTAPSGSIAAESVITQTFDVILYDDPTPNASTGEVLTWGPTSPKSCSYNSGMTGADPEYLDLTWKEDVQITSTQWKTTFQVEDFFDIGPNTITCTATDESGNNATASFTITVEEAPLSNVDLEVRSFDVWITGYPQGAALTEDSWVQFNFRAANVGTGSIN